MTDHVQGIMKLPPDWLAIFAIRPIIQTPDPTVARLAISTAAKKRLSVACINIRRCGGSRVVREGRRKKCTKYMPPIQTTIDRI